MATDDYERQADDAAAISELAALSPLEYDRVRAERAKDLGCQVNSTLSY